MTTEQNPPGSVVYLSEPLARWNVQPYSMSIQGHTGFDMLVVAGSVSFVPTTLATVESWLESWGRSLVDASTIIALAAPVLSLAAAWYFYRRLPLWLVLAAAWVYAVQFLAVDVAGLAYGLYPSSTLLVAVVVLIPAAYVVDKLEAEVRLRLAKSPPAPRG